MNKAIPPINKAMPIRKTLFADEEGSEFEVRLSIQYPAIIDKMNIIREKKSCPSPTPIDFCFGAPQFEHFVEESLILNPHSLHGTKAILIIPIY